MMRKVMMAALGGAALLMGSIGGAQAALLVIDNFEIQLDPNGGDAFIPLDGNLQPTGDPPTMRATQANPLRRNVDLDPSSPNNDNIIGGVRKSELTWISGPSGASFSIDGGVADLSVDAETVANLTLIYDGTNEPFEPINTIGLNGIDLTVGGVGNAFEFVVEFLDLPAANIQIDVWDMDGNLSQFDQDLLFSVGTVLPGSLPAGTSVFAFFADFLPVGLDPADFTDVGALEFRITGAAAIDLRVSQVVVEAPEPATLGILGLGLAALGFGVARRNRRTV